jgi:hypothetical protein
MSERSASRLTTSARGRSARQASILAKQGWLQDNLRFRAIQVLLAAPHGSKLGAARALVSELTERGLKASIRTLYFWRHRFLCLGRAGRRTRKDAGFSRTGQARKRGVQ